MNPSFSLFARRTAESRLQPSKIPGCLVVAAASTRAVRFCEEGASAMADEEKGAFR